MWNHPVKFHSSLPRTKNRRGFTLIELLIVIAIILILIAIALPNFLEAQIRAKVTRARTDMRTISIAMDTYYLDFRMYPPDHDPNDATQRGMIQLTTPLQYLTELPTEQFAQDSGLLGPNAEIGYEMGSTGVRPHLIPLGVGPLLNVNAFNIQCYSPDTDDDWSGNDDWPFCGGGGNACQTGGCNWVNYSPTNGTKSSGDIMLSGGEHRSGSYCIDNWMHIRGKYY